MKKVCIAPFTKSEHVLLNLCKDQYAIHALLTPHGIGYEGMDISILSNNNNDELRITNSPDSALKESDIVLISDVPRENENLFSYSRKILDLAICCGKEIWIFLDLNCDERKQILSESALTGAKCIFPKVSEIKQIDFITNSYGSWKLHKFNLPTIFVSEMVPGCDAFEIFIKMAMAIEKAGKKVLAISSIPYVSVFGFEYVSFDFDESLQNFVFHLNHIVKTLCELRTPEIILIHQPYPMMQYNDNLPFDSGLSSYALSQAIPGDGCIYCSTYRDEPIDFWKSMSSSIETKFGYPIFAIHLSNKMLNPLQDGNYNLISFPSEKAESVIKKWPNDVDIKMFCLLNEPDFENFMHLFMNSYFDERFGVI